MLFHPEKVPFIGSKLLLDSCSACCVCKAEHMLKGTNDDQKASKNFDRCSIHQKSAQNLSAYMLSFMMQTPYTIPTPVIFEFLSLQQKCLGTHYV